MSNSEGIGTTAASTGRPAEVTIAAEPEPRVPGNQAVSLVTNLLAPPGGAKPNGGQRRRYDRASLGYRKTFLKTLYARVRLPLKLLYCRIFKLSRPLIVVLTTNMNCNWKCVYCYGDYPSYGTEKNLSTEEMLRMVDDLVTMGCVYAIVHGGESLLRKDIGYLIDYMKLKGLYVGFITNGQLFPRRIEELRNVDSLTISLDGRRENNDKNRGPGTYDMAMTAIKLALKEGFKLRVSATLTRHTMGDVEYLAALGKEMKFPVFFSLLYRTDLSAKDDPVSLSAEEIRSTLTTIMQLKRRGYPIFTSYQNLEYALRWPYERFNKLYLFEDQVPKDFKKLTCHYSKLKFHIEGDGTVTPCTIMSSNNFAGKNVRDVGVREAVGHVRDTNTCVACPHLSQNDWNLLMDLQPRHVAFLIKEQIKELTRWF